MVIHTQTYTHVYTCTCIQIHKHYNESFWKIFMNFQTVFIQWNLVITYNEYITDRDGFRTLFKIEVSPSQFKWRARWKNVIVKKWGALVIWNILSYEFYSILLGLGPFVHQEESFLVNGWQNCGSNFCHNMEGNLSLNYVIQKKELDNKFCKQNLISKMLTHTYK